MKKFLIILTACIWSVVSVQNVAAQGQQDTFGLEGEDFLSDADEYTPKSSSSAPKATFSDFLSRTLTTATLKPIKNAEVVFCYVVDYASVDSEGYTVNGLAVKGFCGELSTEGRRLIQDALLNNTLAFSKSKADCKINPKILLRYVHGIDYTDVLLSSPCSSLTFFHNNDIISVNTAPGSDIVEQIVTAYGSLKEDFLSPAMLGQMIGNGVPQTQAQKEIIRRNTPAEPPRIKWDNKSDESQPAATDEPQPAQSGWNKLK